MSTVADALRTIAAGVLALAEAAAAGETRPAVSDDPLVAALESGIGVRRFRALVRTGELPAVRVGRRYLARHSAIEAWLARQGVEPRRPRAATTMAGAAPPKDDVDAVIARELARGSLRVVRGNK